ncbi:hypothetical protein CERSUDRAFT_109526 [Gelatoporia subvermispora B]|uniref:THUMP domain-containing protein n=1 Tax=Ceriporiopsis subvermispora (strain B) TaxID=914234 RepID=M2P7Q6_CERS8|nr:hypothetical protein CERSUDRAFT_109526 [Gelatoporia subvermispora B]
MEQGKRKSDGKDRSRRRFRADGTPIWGGRQIDGPGVWATCVKGKEKQAVGELYDLFESLASELWPDEDISETKGDASDNDDDNGDLEAQIAREVASMKRPRKEQRFANCQTDTPCVVFISCKRPVDPLQLVQQHIQNVSETGVTNTRHILRLTPVSGSCVANVPEIQNLCNRILTPYFTAEADKKYKYKIEMRVRNHNKISRDTLIQTIAKCVPEGHIVDLENPEVFILVEVFKGVCGMSVVKDYYKHQKYNVAEIAKAKNQADSADGVTRVGDKTAVVESASDAPEEDKVVV